MCHRAIVQQYSASKAELYIIGAFLDMVYSRKKLRSISEAILLTIRLLIVWGVPQADPSPAAPKQLGSYWNATVTLTFCIIESDMLQNVCYYLELHSSPDL